MSVQPGAEVHHQRSQPDRSAQLRACWRSYSDRVARNEAGPTLKIALSASFTVNSLTSYLGGHMVSEGLSPAIQVGPFNQIFQVCLDYKHFFATDTDVLVLLFRFEDFLIEEIDAALHGDGKALSRAMAKIALLTSAFVQLRSQFSGTIVLSLPPYPTTLSQHLLSLQNPTGLGLFHHELAKHLVERIEEIKSIHMIDLDAIQRECGLSRSYDSRQWYLYRQPFSESFLVEAGTLLSRLILATRRSPKKCIVLDCDNTLWGGIIGEDGLTGLALGDEFPGSSYRDFQRLLLYLHQQGVLLALASKNNEADVWEVFDKHSGMLLKREHLAGWQINWESKSENITKIAKALNIGLDSLVFIDDNAMEIEFMRAARPEVTSILLPEELADILGLIRGLPLFDRLEVTHEDRHRTDMTRAEQQRAQLGASMTKEEFLRSVELRIDFFRSRPEDLERIVQLINKTNQFNLTTIRRSLDQVRLIAGLANYRIYGLKIRDKFGEYGLTGVIICEISTDRSRWTIDTLLLSCRVLGRGVEASLLAAVAREAEREGASEVVASYIPTAKNALAASFLPDHGFELLEGNSWRIDVARVAGINPSVTLVCDTAPAAKATVSAAI